MNDEWIEIEDADEFNRSLAAVKAKVAAELDRAPTEGEMRILRLALARHMTGEPTAPSTLH